MRCLDVLKSVAGWFTLPCLKLVKLSSIVLLLHLSGLLWGGADWLAARGIGKERSVGKLVGVPHNTGHLTHDKKEEDFFYYIYIYISIFSLNFLFVSIGANICSL